MAKLYRFRLTTVKAEFHVGYMSLVYDGKTHFPTEYINRTFPDAMLALAEYAERAPAPCRVYIGMESSRDRVPPGFRTAVTHIDKPE